MLRLVAYAPGGVERFAVPSGSVTLGCDPACEIVLPWSGVARRHARLTSLRGELEIEDLGSRRGVIVNGQRVRAARLAALDEIRLGALTLLVEDAGSPPRAGSVEAPLPAPAADPMPMTPARLLERVCRFSRWVLADVASHGTAEDQIGEILRAFGGGVAFLLRHDAPPATVRLAVATEPRWHAAGAELLAQVPDFAAGEVPLSGSVPGQLEGRPAWIFHRRITAFDRVHVFIVALPGFSGGDWCEAGFSTLADLVVLGLVHHVGHYEPLMLGQGRERPLRLAPGLVVGVSPAIQRLLLRLAQAAGTSEPLLLLGESGTGRREWARSAHLSSDRSEAPFASVACDGGSAVQLAAEIFGADVAGRQGTLRRPGKLSQVDRGTLLLEDVDSLPLAVQARLARFVRTGVVDAADGGPGQAVDVRLISTAREPLENAVAGDRFRVDLAYVLSRLVIEVPALRERREEFPLLIQTLVNRFCHETGKRVQGITVDAMAALTRYSYPGNFPEIENVVRQLIYLAAPGQPIDSALLPERLRAAEAWAATRVDAASPLQLADLVAVCEAAAIREALRRAKGNKVHAAKLLGISRNGLALKMARHEIRP